MKTKNIETKMYVHPNSVKCYGSVQVVKEQWTWKDLSIIFKRINRQCLSHKVCNMHLTLSKTIKETDDVIVYLISICYQNSRQTNYPEKNVQWTFSKLLSVLFIKCRWDGIVCGWAFFCRLDKCGHGQGNHVDTDYKTYDHTEWTPLLFHCAKSVGGGKKLNEVHQ